MWLGRETGHNIGRESGHNRVTGHHDPQGGRPVSVLIAIAAMSITVVPAPASKAANKSPYDSAKADLAAKISDPAQATEAYLAAVPQKERQRTAYYADGVFA